MDFDYFYERMKSRAPNPEAFDAMADMHDLNWRLLTVSEAVVATP